MTSYFLVLATLVFFLYHYFTKTFNHWKSKNVKGPRPIPLFGNILQVALRNKPNGIFFRELYQQYPKEKVIGIYQMTSPTLIIRDLDLVKQIMIKNFDMFPDRGTYFSKDGLGENIFHSDADTWKFLRYQFTSLYTTCKIKNMFHRLADRGDKFVNCIDNMISKQPEQDTYQLLLKYTVTTSLLTTLGWDVDTFNDKTEWYHTLDQNLNNSPLNEINQLFSGILTKLNLSVLAKKTRRICLKIAKACVEQETVSNNNISNVRELLWHLKHEGKAITDEAEPNIEITDALLAGQIWVFYTASYLNNNVTLTYALYYLACNPDVQEKLREEVDKVIKNNGNGFTYEIVKEMKYLGRVFDETLRLHPTTHGLVRCASEDVKLEGLDFTIKKGTNVVVPSYAIHRDEKYYSEPERFNPDRFLAEYDAERHPCAYIAFGIGRRSCLGSQLARIQFGICIAKLMQRFKVETTQNTCSSLTFDNWHMLLKPKEAIHLKFVARDK
ncbi:cytochrome P450 6B5-like [Anticarsia gemmatalis]|uniref:cytochrome P450 6B5-like n=1 Tax=Anticarsia gemmatalis TaxID=129554 RepID=UPI003F772BB8